MMCIVGGAALWVGVPGAAKIEAEMKMARRAADRRSAMDMSDRFENEA
jgi:hypothetical protein